MWPPGADSQATSKRPAQGNRERPGRRSGLQPGGRAGCMAASAGQHGGGRAWPRPDDLAAACWPRPGGRAAAARADRRGRAQRRAGRPDSRAAGRGLGRGREGRRGRTASAATRSAGAAGRACVPTRARTHLPAYLRTYPGGLPRTYLPTYPGNKKPRGLPGARTAYLPPTAYRKPLRRSARALWKA